MKQGATLLFEKKPKKNTKKIVYASTCPCPQGFEVVGDAKYHRLHLPAIAPRRADSNHGVVHRARGYEPRRRQGDRLLRVGAEPGNRRHRAGGFRCREPASRLHEGDGGSAAKAASEFSNMHIYSTTSLKMDMSGSLSVIVGTLVPFLLKPLRQLLLRVPGSADRETTCVNDELRRMMDGVVNDRAAARGDLASASSQKQKQHKDFLSVVLAVRDRDESTRELLSPDYLSALTYEHLHAGSVTRAFTLSSVLYLVAQHPEVEEKLLREIDGFGPRDRVPTADDLQTKFPYLDQARTYHCTAPRPTIHKEIDTHACAVTQVVKESMRFVSIGGARDLRACGDRWLCPSKGVQT
jgi:hypothetical protein